jgi:hypothetical protein
MVLIWLIAKSTQDFGENVFEEKLPFAVLTFLRGKLLTFISKGASN